MIRTRRCYQKSIWSTFEWIQNSVVVVEGLSEIGEARAKVGEVATRLWRTGVTSKKDGGWSTRSANGSQGLSVVVDGGD